MELTGINRKIIEESPFGLYVWQMPDGRWVGDDEGNYLNVAAKKGDFNKIKMLTDAVRGYGIEEGAPVFLSGHRRITDEELAEQRARLQLGLVPDPYDTPAISEDLHFRNDG